MKLTPRDLNAALDRLCASDPKYTEVLIRRVLQGCAGAESSLTPQEIRARFDEVQKANPRKPDVPESVYILAVDVVNEALGETEVSPKSDAVLDEATVIVTAQAEETVVPESNGVDEDTIQPVAPEPKPETEPKVVAEEPRVPKVEAPLSFSLSDWSGYQTDHQNKPIDIVASSENEFTVSWKPSSEGDKVYLVVASIHPVATPSKAGTDDLKFVTKGSSVFVPVGKKHLVVFEGDTVTKKNRVFGRAEFVGTIDNLKVKTFKDQVHLRWDTQDVDAKVLIERFVIDAAGNTRDAVGKTLSRDPIPAKEFRDTDSDLKMGVRYEYRVWLEKQSGDNSPSRSAKTLTQRVEIAAEIPALEHFEVKAGSKSGLVDFIYQQPSVEGAQVKVYLVNDRPSTALLEVLHDEQSRVRLTEDLDTPEFERIIGERMQLENAKPDQDGKVSIPDNRIKIDEFGFRTFVAVVVVGNQARIDSCRVLNPIAPMGGTEMIDRYDYQLLRVEIPEGASNLELWQALPGAKWAETSQERRNRLVRVADVYRPNGGILFTEFHDSLDAAPALGCDPMTLFTRGQSEFDGTTSYSPGEGASRVYPGRIEIHVKLVPLEIRTESRGFLGLSKTEQVVGVENQIHVKVVSPVQGTVKLIAELLSPNANQGLDLANEGAAERVIDLNLGDYKDWKPLMVGDSAAQKPLIQPEGRKVRIRPSISEYIDIPIFVINEAVDIEKQRLKSVPLAVDPNRRIKVVIAGVKQSGKTTYVQALINQLKNQFALNFRFDLQAKSESAKWRLEELNEFLRTGERPKFTPVAADFDFEAHDPKDPRQPIIFELANGGPNKPFGTLEIIDVAGEDMDRGFENMAKYYEEHFLAADLIIYIFDPLQNAVIADVLAGKPIPPQASNPTDVLKNIHNLVKGKPSRNPNQSIALVVSKSDFLETALEKIAEGNGGQPSPVVRGMSITRDPNAWSTRPFNEVDSQAIEEEITEAIGNFLGIGTLFAYAKEQIVECPVKFFVVSALGHDQLGPTISKAGMTSFRVSDPLLWVAMKPATTQPAG